jgi:hypothetical protein
MDTVNAIRLNSLGQLQGVNQAGDAVASLIVSDINDDTVIDSHVGKYIILNSSVKMPALQGAAAATDININASNEVFKVTSKEEFKRGIQPLNERFNSELVFDLEPRSFVWKESGVEDFGLIAEEVHEIFPGLVSYDEDGKPYSIRYTMLSVLLLEEIKKLKEQLERLSYVKD